MLKERIVEFVETLSSEDKAELSAYLREQDQKAYDQEGLEIARQRSEEVKSGKVEMLSSEDFWRKFKQHRESRREV